MGTFAKLTVEKDYELRKAVRGAGAKYRVVKNTLAERAAKGTKVEEAVKDLAGVTSIAYTSGDPVALAKALSKYAKDHPEYTFKAGIVEGRVIAIKDIDALASMPSKEEIYSQAAVPDERSGAASGDGDERGGPRPGRGHRPGREEKQVWRRRAAGAKRLPAEAYGAAEVSARPCRHENGVARRRPGCISGATQVWRRKPPERLSYPL